MTSGVTDEGFVRAPAAEIKAELEAAHDAQFGRAVRKDARSVFGQLIGIQTGSFADLWELAELVAQSRDPRAAIGAALDAICALTGTLRKAATYSTVSLVLTGDNATSVASGKIATSTDGTIRYATTSTATLATATSWVSGGTVATGAYRTRSSNIYRAVVGGVGGTGGPTITDPYPETETDGAITWVWIGAGAALDIVDAKATESGPIGGSAYSINTISAPVTGWNGVANEADAELGRDIERDDELRARRPAELHALAAKGSIDAIRGNILKLTGVEECTVFENVDADENADGIPGHAIEAVVRGSVADEDVGNALLATVAAGIKTFGNTAVVVADARGGSHTVYYTVPEDVDIYLAVAIEADKKLWPSESLADVDARGSSRVEAAILAYGLTVLSDGRDVDPSEIEGAVYAAGIPGRLSTTATLSTSPSPSERERIPITARQIARLDSARTTVTVTYRSP